MKGLAPGTQLQDALLMSLYDPGAQMAMANTAEELGRRYRISREEADRFALRSQTNTKAARDAGGVVTMCIGGGQGIAFVLEAA